MKKYYELTITQEGPRADKKFKNVIYSESLNDFYEKLARCYRDLNKAERASAIKQAKHAIANIYDEEKRAHHFIIKYDVFSDNSTISVYHWVFYGLGDSM